MSKAGRWLSDLLWAANLVRARRARRRLLFTERVRFDNVLRPIVGATGSKAIMAYPDALYHLTRVDVDRAMGLVASVAQLQEQER